MPDGSYATVALVAAEGHPEGVTVYNFEVRGDHTYFVSAAGQPDAAVWVHNACDFSAELRLAKNPARAKLNRRLGGTPGDAMDAHHIIPLDLANDVRTREVVERAARGGFDINAATNGILLSDALHTGGHARYINGVAQKVSGIGAHLTDHEAAQAVQAIADNLRTALGKLRTQLV
jgi:hypothetical protein